MLPGCESQLIYNSTASRLRPDASALELPPNSSELLETELELSWSQKSPRGRRRRPRQRSRFSEASACTSRLWLQQTGEKKVLITKMGGLFVGFAAGVLAERTGVVGTAEQLASPYWAEYVAPQLRELSKQATTTCVPRRGAPPGRQTSARVCGPVKKARPLVGLSKMFKDLTSGQLGPVEDLATVLTLCPLRSARSGRLAAGSRRTCLSTC